ncbi:BQ00720 family protein [Phyllobacterium sp. K27]
MQTNPLTELEFSRLGAGQVAYLRKVNTDDLATSFPALPPMAPGVELWALFAANGDPIVLSDERENVLVGAQEHELRTVMLQ